MRRAILNPMLLLASCAWEAPVVEDTAAVGNVLTGTVVVNASEVTGPVLVLLYAADDPPPPEGTGRPVALASISKDAFSGGAGVQSAPFALTEVPDGTWLVTALLDVDQDFHPLVTATAGATCGDMLGAYLSDIETGELGVVEVAGGGLVEGLTVAVASTMPLERPAFVFEENSVDWATGDYTVTLRSTDVAAVSTTAQGESWSVLTLTGPLDLAAVAEDPTTYNPCDVHFPVYMPDDDGAGDGNPHPNSSYAELGLVEIWPRFYLTYAGDDLEEGESYVSEAVWSLPLDADLFVTYLMSGALAFNTVNPLTELELYLPPAALHVLPDGTEETVSGADVPAGAWSLSVVSFTGQTWTLPNDLAGLGSASATWTPSEQGLYVLVE